jgi:hypothetical protein
MSTISSHTLPEFSAAPLLVKPSVEAAAGRSAEVKKDPTSRPLGKRATLAFAYYLIVISVGVAATLAWQAYGDAVRRLTAPAASTSDQQQLNAMPLDLDAVRGEVLTGSPLASAPVLPPVKSRQRAASISSRPPWSR